MPETKEYDIELPWGVTTSALLSEEDAAKYGDRAKVKKATAPADKSRKASSDK